MSTIEDEINDLWILFTSSSLAATPQGLSDTEGTCSTLECKNAELDPPGIQDAQDVVKICNKNACEPIPKDDCLFSEVASEKDDRWKNLCVQLLSVSERSVSDEDLLALLLSHICPSKASKQIATDLITRFETFGSVLGARMEQIYKVTDVYPDLANFISAIRAAGTRLAREDISTRPLFDNWDKLIKYLHAVLAYEMVEQFRVLFLDRRNVLIADELQHRGTIDHTPVYPREVAKRALELDASAVIMVHNHPSNNPTPSNADIEMTKVVSDALEKLGIVLHDHIIISRGGHTSFRVVGLLGPKGLDSSHRSSK